VVVKLAVLMELVGSVTVIFSKDTRLAGAAGLVRAIEPDSVLLGFGSASGAGMDAGTGDGSGAGSETSPGASSLRSMKRAGNTFGFGGWVDKPAQSYSYVGLKKGLTGLLVSTYDQHMGKALAERQTASESSSPTLLVWSRQ
jgi:hypothetical protein